MASPFPGIDPYLESQGLWPGFHNRFVTYWCDALIDSLPDNYSALMDERVSLVKQAPEQIKRIEPDVAILQNGPTTTSPTTSAGVATLEPVTIPLVIEEEERQTFIEIRHRPDRKLVTVLELLSPSNKEEPGRTNYLDKRHALLRQYVNLVELDFLLAGQRLPLSKSPPPGDYYAYIARANCRPNCDVYAWNARRLLPTIPIPLLPPDPDIWIDLAAIFKKTYERGRYAREINYDEPLPAPFRDASQS